MKSSSCLLSNVIWHLGHKFLEGGDGSSLFFGLLILAWNADSKSCHEGSSQYMKLFFNGSVSHMGGFSLGEKGDFFLPLVISLFLCYFVSFKHS